MNEIWGTIKLFVELIETGEENIEKNQSKLCFLLDKLSYEMHSVSGNLDNEGTKIDIEFDETYVRELVIERFPSYGLYNQALNVTENVGLEEFGIGDAIDDIVDIYIDLKCALGNCDGDGEEQALWVLQFEYRIHWGKHLRDLQSYIFNLEYEK